MRSTSNSGIVTTASGGTVKKITIVWNTTTSADRTLDVYGKGLAYESAANLYSSESTKGKKIASATYATKGTAQTDVLEITGDYSYIGLRSKSGAMYIDKITIEWEVAETGAPAKPTIAPESGMFEESQKVTITSEDGATVWYTTDGTDPEKDGATSTKYTTSFTVNTTTTVKAIAVNGENIASGIASATYTKKEWLNGLSALVAKIKKDNSTSVKEYYVNLTGAVVSGVLGTYNAYLEEGETGILLNEGNHGLTLAQKYSGKATVSAKIDNGTPKLTAFDCATVEEGATLPLTTVTLAELTANFDKYLSRRVKVEDVTVTTELVDKKAEIEQNETTFAVYTNDGDITMEKNTIVDIIGWPNLYTTKQLSIWAQADITSKGVAKVFQFPVDAVSVRIDKSFTEPTLENTYDETPVYSSSNVEVATVNASTGEVNIVTVGETTIIATLPVAGKEASYTLTVNPIPAKVDGNYYLVTNESEIVVGGRYLIVATGSDFAMSTTQNTNNRGQVSIERLDDAISPTDGAQEIVLCAGNNSGEYVLKVEDGYLYAASSGSNHLKTHSELTNSSATITIDKGIATIKFQGEYTRNWLRHNSSSNIFSCYGSGQADIQLYKLYSPSRQGEFSISGAGYATFFTDKPFIIPAGVEGAIVTNAVAEGTMTLDWKYTEGATVPAETGLLLNGAQGTYAYDITETAETAPADNMLKGSVKDAMTTGEGCLFYKLSYNNGENLGFYWGAEDGAAFMSKAGKAYLAVPAEVGANVKGFAIDGNEVTGITSVGAQKNDGAIYNMQGVRVQNTNRKGIYIINGKKVIK